MMIESMAGKSASMHGLVHDATPFTFSEDNSAIDYFGKMLIEGKLRHWSLKKSKISFGSLLIHDMKFLVIYYSIPSQTCCAYVFIPKISSIHNLKKIWHVVERNDTPY